MIVKTVRINDRKEYKEEYQKNEGKDEYFSRTKALLRGLLERNTSL